MTLARVFQERRLRLFTGAQRLIFPVLILSCTKALNSFLPSSLCLTRSFFVFSFITTFVTKLYRSVLVFWSDEKGLVKVLIVSVNLFMLLSSCVKTAEFSSLWYARSGTRPAIALASAVSRASSGAMRKNLARALSFKVIPTSPPELS